MTRRQVRAGLPWFAAGAATMGLVVLAARFPMPAIAIGTVVYAAALVAFEAARFWRDAPP
jgi:hypothetical protein